MTRYFEQIAAIRMTEYRRRCGDKLTAEQLAFLCGADPRMIRAMVDVELINPADPEGRLFDISLVPQVKRALRLRYDLGVGWVSMPLVLRLLDRIEELERRAADPTEPDPQG